MTLARLPLLVLTLLAALVSPAGAVYEGFIIPSAAVAAFPAQSRVFSQDLQILADGARGNGVVHSAGACAVLQAASPDMTVRLTTGCTIVVNTATASVTTGNFTIAAANATNPRIDVVGATSAGVKTTTTGTAAASPLPPTIPDNHVVFAFVYVPATDTAIGTTQITDKRIFVQTPGSGSGAGTGLSYITKVAEGTLSNEFALGSLPTGLVVNTVTTGVPTVLAPTDDNVAVGSGSAWQLKALPTCSGATSALTYNISTNAFGCNTISGGSGPTITTFATPASPSDATLNNLVVNSLTVRTVTRIFIPGAITLNQLTFSPGVITTAGTMRLCLYSMNGTTKLVDVASGTPVANTPTSTAVASVVIDAGEYYFVMGCATTCNLQVLAFPPESGTAQAFGLNSPAGKPKWHGSVTHTSGTCNATLGTITGTISAQPVIRGDN